jgi:hypothetical protein
VSARGLRIVVTGLGCVALVFGVLGVVTGGAGVVGGGHVSANVDSELRFFAAWYAGAGVLLLCVRQRVDRETVVVRGVCAAILLGAAGRVLSIVTVGAPHALFLFLLAVELVIPAVIVPWQAAVARRAHAAAGSV